MDGGFHDVDSSVLAFEIARTRSVPRSFAKKAVPCCWEPIMKVGSGPTPEDYTGSVMGDLLGRAWPGARSGYARQCGDHQCDGAAGQHVWLRQSIAVLQVRGRANYTMQFDHYEQVPAGEAAKVQAKYALAASHALKNLEEPDDGQGKVSAE